MMGVPLTATLSPVEAVAALDARFPWLRCRI